MTRFHANQGRPPDRLEVVVRAVCGGVLGVVVGGGTVLWLGEESGLVIAALMVACTASSAWLAAVHGDRFWHDVGKYLPWV